MMHLEAIKDRNAKATRDGAKLAYRDTAPEAIALRALAGRATYLDIMGKQRGPMDHDVYVREDDTAEAASDAEALAGVYRFLR